MTFEERVAMMDLLDSLTPEQVRLVLAYARTLREQAAAEHALEALVDVPVATGR
jgi:hypothetical protein